VYDYQLKSEQKKPLGSSSLFPILPLFGATSSLKIKPANVYSIRIKFILVKFAFKKCPIWTLFIFFEKIE